MALHAVEVDTCPGCGQPLSESTAAEAEFGYVTTPIRCHSCAAIRRGQRKFLDGSSSSASDGLSFTVTRKRS